MGDINLNDMEFDFDDYFERFRSGDMSGEERKEYDARVLGLFCKSLIKNNNDPAAIPKWVAKHMRRQIYNVLSGYQFVDAFCMPKPWQQRATTITRAEQAALDIFVDIANALASDASLGITDAITKGAKKNNCSFQKARAAYYEHNEHLPKGFIKSRKNV
jgi:hypothetical protein